MPSFLRASFFFSLIFLLSACATQHPLPEQNAFAYLPKETLNQPLVSLAQQKQNVQNYLDHYFSPWTGNQLINRPDEVDAYERGVIIQYIQSPGVGSNRLKHADKWVQEIAGNMNLTAANTSINAITTTSTDERILPTLEPVFLQWNNVNTTDGYPFDRLQNSLLTTNTPVRILRTSVDGAWQLVITPSSFGWVRSRDLATVNQHFIRQWHVSRYVVMVRDHIAIKDSEGLFRLHTHVGEIFPLVRREAHRFQILIAVPGVNHQAILKHVWVDRNTAQLWPLSLTQKSIGTLANTMLGEPYGWGGMYGYRDCSATMQDLFGSVGIWLPRNSKDQILVGNPISLQGLSWQEGKKTLEAKGIPGFTLLRLPGHIFLYIGNKDHMPYVYQTVWREGATVITPYQQAEEMVVLEKNERGDL